MWAKGTQRTVENAAPEKTIGAIVESVSPILSRNSYFIKWIDDGVIIQLSPIFTIALSY